MRANTLAYAPLSIFLFFIGFLIAAIVLLIQVSFFHWDPDVHITRVLTIENYIKFFSDPFFLSSVALTLRISVLVTFGSVLLGFPLAYAIAVVHSRRVRTLLLAITLTPLFVDAVVINIGWLFLFAPSGLVNQITQSLGLGSFKFLFNEPAVVIALIHGSIPIVTLTLTSAIQRIPRSLVQAAQNLGAGPIRSFLKIILPLSVPGIVASSVLIFTLSMAAFVTPTVLGGGNVRMISLLTAFYFVGLLNWPQGAAVALVLATIVLGTVYIHARMTRKWLRPFA